MLRSRAEAERWALALLSFVESTLEFSPELLARVMDKLEQRSREVGEAALGWLMMDRIEFWGYGLLPEDDPGKGYLREIMRDPLSGWFKQGCRRRGWVRDP